MANKSRLTSLNPARPIDPSEYAEARVMTLLSQYEKARKDLLAIANDAKSSQVKITRANNLLAQIDREILKLLNQIAPTWSEEATEAIYKHGYRLSQQTARVYDIDVVDNFDSQLNKYSIAILSEQLTNDLLVTNNLMADKVGRYIRLSSQSRLVDTKITETILQGEIQGLTRRQVSNRLIKDLESEIFNGNLINVGGRVYNIHSYVELLARTRMREAATQGTLNAAVELGMDLVQIDVHGDACNLCMTRMGRVFSISGTNSDFPVLDISPPFHPNCRCNIFPITDIALKERGRYEAISKLSKGTPRFTKATEAGNWLKKNPRYKIFNHNDFTDFVRNN